MISGLRLRGRGIVAVILALLVFLSQVRAQTESSDSTDILLAAPITTTSAGTAGMTAVKSVVRVICPVNGNAGTGFHHKSGRVVTAAHVVSGCTEVIVVPATGQAVEATPSVVSSTHDLAVLTVAQKLNLPALGGCPRIKVNSPLIAR